MNLGERIKQIRKARGLSAESIAKELGVSVSTVYRYEDLSIEKIPVGIFNKLCTILDVSPSELMNGNLSNTMIVSHHFQMILTILRTQWMMKQLLNLQTIYWTN